ncbi:MAG: hypothetical protein ABFS02_05220 [Pseudomonadota bacterium]
MDVHNSSVHFLGQTAAIERHGLREAKERVRLLSADSAGERVPAHGATLSHSPDEIEAVLKNLPSATMYSDFQSGHQPQELPRSSPAKHAIDAYTAQFLQPQIEERSNLSALLGIDFYV